MLRRTHTVQRHSALHLAVAGVVNHLAASCRVKANYGQECVDIKLNQSMAVLPHVHAFFSSGKAARKARLLWTTIANLQLMAQSYVSKSCPPGSSDGSHTCTIIVHSTPSNVQVT